MAYKRYIVFNCNGTSVGIFETRPDLETRDVEVALMAAGFKLHEMPPKPPHPVKRGVPTPSRQLASCDGRLDRGQTGKIDIVGGRRAT